MVLPFVLIAVGTVSPIVVRADPLPNPWSAVDKGGSGVPTTPLVVTQPGANAGIALFQYDYNNCPSALPGCSGPGWFTSNA